MLRTLKQLRQLAHTASTFALVWLSAAALSHEINPAVIDAEILPDNRIEFRIELNLEAQISDIAATHSNSEDAPNALTYQQLRSQNADGLVTAAQPWLATLTQQMRIRSDEPITLAITDVIVSDVGDTNIARDSTVVLITEQPVTRDWTLEWDEWLGPAAFRLSTEDTDDVHTAYLFEGKDSGVISMENLVSVSSWQVFVDYIPVGFAHIVPLGIDHILFVIGLYLFSTHWRPLLLQVSAFTVAHTLTLALSMLDIIRLPASLVEPIIAASIVYVAVENILFPNHKWWRPIVVFGFGLIHGLGFASVLTDFGLSNTSFIGGLIGFNVGVELGQLTVIALCFLGFGLWFRHKAWYRSVIVVNLSVAISLVGSFWFVQRVFF